MQKITDIQPQKKREGYYSVFVDGVYSFSLSELDVSITGIRIGEEIDNARLIGLQKAAQQSKIYSRAIYYLRFGPRSVWQMRQYLVHKVGFERDEVELILQKLIDESYLNDKSYIESYVYSRQISRPRSTRQLRAELINKGISKQDIDSYLVKIDPNGQREAAKQVMQKKLLLPKFQDKQKLTEYMIRQGFPFGLVRDVLQEINLESS